MAGLQLIKSVNLISLPAVCFMLMSKWFNLSNHRVSRALHCLFALNLCKSGSSAWWSENSCTCFPYRWNLNLSRPQTTASSSSSPIEYFFSALILLDFFRFALFFFAVCCFEVFDSLSSCVVCFAAAHSREVSYFVAVVAFHGLCGAFVLWGLILLSAESTVVTFCCLFGVLLVVLFVSWLYFLYWFLFYFFFFCECWGDCRLFMSLVVTVLGY